MIELSREAFVGEHYHRAPIANAFLLFLSKVLANVSYNPPSREVVVRVSLDADSRPERVVVEFVEE